MNNYSGYRVIARNKPLSASRNILIGSDGARTTILHITATSSGAGIWEGTMDPVNAAHLEADADWFPLPSITLRTGIAAVVNLPGATITPTDDDVLCADNMGGRHVRFRRTAGTATGSVSLAEAPLAEIAASAGGGGDASAANQLAHSTLFGAVTETAPATDTASSGLNGRLQRIAQRITSLIALLPTALAGLGGLKVEEPGVTNDFFIPDGTDELLISAAARRAYGVQAQTIDATPIYVKLYDKATAASEADTPVWVGLIPANATSTLGAGANFMFPKPIALTNGLSIRVVTGLANNSDAAVTTAENIINTFWSA